MSRPALLTAAVLSLSAALVAPLALAQTAAPTTATAPAANNNAAASAATARDLAAKARATYPAGRYSIDQTLWKQAATAAESAVQADPQNPDTLKLRAQIYTEVGFWKKAEDAWAAYFKVAPQSGAGADQAAAFAQYNLGYAAYTRGASSQAAKFFENCLKLDAQNVLCNAWAGRTALEAGNYVQAQAAYAQAQKLSPDDKSLAYFAALAQKAGTYGPAATTAFSQAYAELDAGHKPAALAKFQEAAKAAPNFADALRESGRLALELGDAPAALSAYQGATALPSATAADRYNLALAQEGAQFGLKAVQTFRAAYAKYTSGDKAGALTGFMQATTQNPNYAKAWAWVGRVNYENKDYTAAADAYAKAVQLDPNDKSSAYYLNLAQQGK